MSSKISNYDDDEDEPEQEVEDVESNDEESEEEMSDSEEEEEEDYDELDLMDEKIDLVKEDLESDIIDFSETKYIMYTQPKITRNIMTKYEKTRIIGTRITQLVRGAKTLLTREEQKDCHSFEDIVEMELTLRKCPLSIKRVLPNNVVEYWKLRDMIIM